MANIYKNAFFDLTTTDKTDIYTVPSDSRAIIQNHSYGKYTMLDQRPVVHAQYLHMIILQQQNMKYLHNSTIAAKTNSQNHGI